MPDILQLTNNLIKHAARPEWAALLNDIWEEHILFTAMLMGVEEDELASLLDARDWRTSLHGLVFEDFATIELEQDAAPAPNFALAYLKRAGWRETPRARRYLQALAESQPSLYEVLEVRLDEGLFLQDRLNPGEPIWVKEKSATHQLRCWDILYTRVVRPEPHEAALITGGTVRFTPDDGAELINLVEPMHEGPPEGAPLPRLALLTFTHWVTCALEHLTQTLDACNADGHPLVICKARIPLRVLPGAVAQKLDHSGEWERPEPGSMLWQQTRATDGRIVGSFDILVGPHRSLIASAEIQGRSLIVHTNSEERLTDALQSLRACLGAAALGEPTIERSYPSDVLLADEDDDEAQYADDDSDSVLTPEEERAILKPLLDAHYRRTLRSRIPALDNKTPRMALRTKSGRAKVIEWLKVIENGSQAQGYDASWMWEALGLAEERAQTLRNLDPAAKP